MTATATAAQKSMTNNFRRYHYVLAPETSDEDSDSNKTESVYSMQDKETEYVRDESDTCTKSEASEYTLYSIPSEKNPMVDTDSSEEFIIKTTRITVDIHTMSSQSSNNEHEVDSTMESSEDSELGQADYWYCAQCNKSNNHPKYRYCMKCFRLKKEMFPPKPKATKKRRATNCKSENNNKGVGTRSLCKKRKRQQSSVENSDEDPDKTLGNSQSKSIKLDSSMKLDTFIGKFENLHPGSQIFSKMCDEVDEIQASKRLKQSNEHTPNVEISEGATNATSLEASNVNTNSMTTKSLIGRFGTLNTSSQFFSNMCESVDQVYENALNEHPLANQSSKQVATAPVTTSDIDRIDDATSTSALCIMCDKAPKNGAFVHAYEIHACCCYLCARKVWNKTKKCPTCTLPASKVLKLIIS